MPDSDRGAALVWVAGSLVMLFAFAALAVDVGWIYLNQQRLQRAADAAALAGVVNVPYLTQANTDAQGAAAANEYGAASFAGSIIGDDQYHVELSDVSLPLFLAPVIGWDDVTLSAEATAQYVPSVPLGSPYSCFGGEPVASGDWNTMCPGVPSVNFTAAINGRYTDKTYGDAYASVCNVSNSSTSACNSGSTNAEYQRPGQGNWDGYFYAIKVPAGASSLTVSLYDAPAHCARTGSSPSSSCYNFAQTGVGDYRQKGSSLPTTTYTLMAPDTTEWDPTDNTPIGGSCTASYAGDMSSPYPYYATWDTLCTTATGGVEETFFLQVQTTGNAAANNAYSISAVTDVGTPQVYGVRDMSIYQKVSSSDDLPIAEVGETHAGKSLVLEFFDAGDAGTANFQLKMPDGSGGLSNVPNPYCSWTSYEQDHVTVTETGTGCYIPASGRFNNEWLTVEIDIPSSYTCGSYCWWIMNMNMSAATERTTWTARVIGNPVRLVQSP